jgi:hypothetical protein
MWPTVLVRAYENSYQIYDLVDTDDDDEKNIRRDAIGDYDLFRNGLVGHPDWNRNDGVDSNNNFRYGLVGHPDWIWNDGVDNDSNNGSDINDTTKPANSNGDGRDNNINVTKNELKRKRSGSIQ